MFYTHMIMSTLAFVSVTCAPQYRQTSRPPIRNIPILKYEFDGVQPDGSYQWMYSTGDGISAKEQGQLLGSENPETREKEVTGSYEYSTGDGTTIRVTYVANKGGFQPKITFMSHPSSAIHPEVVTVPSSTTSITSAPTETENPFVQGIINLNINDNPSILQLS